MSNPIIPAGLRADIMRNRMLDKNGLNTRGAMYYGTGTLAATPIAPDQADQPYEVDVLTLGSENDVLVVQNEGGSLVPRWANKAPVAVSADSTPKWTTQRNFSISNTAAANAGLGVNVDGTSDVVLSVPTTMSGFASISSTSFNSTSDMRLKTNIKPYCNYHSILDLPIMEFDYKTDGSHHIGCLAQDLQKICPEIVHEDQDGYLSIEENKIVYLLLKEVKELKAEIEKLKGE